MKRREFVKSVLSSAAGIAMGIPTLSAFSCTTNIDKKIALAIIGCGSRGMQVINELISSGANVEIKTICDVNALRANEAAKTIERMTGISVFIADDIKTTLDDPDIDAVWIATPNHWHALAAIWACRKGKDVYLEPNPFNSIQEGQDVLKVASKHKRIVQIGFQNRSASHSIAARTYIREGLLGQILHVKCYSLFGDLLSWNPQNNTESPEGLNWNEWIGPAPYRPYNPGIYDVGSGGGWNHYWNFGSGTLGMRAAHVMDLARMVLGDLPHPQSVYCHGSNNVWGSKRETPEFQSVVFDYDSFAMTCECGNLTNYTYNSPGEKHPDFPIWDYEPSRIEIYGTKGLMYLGDHKVGWQVLGKNAKILDQYEGKMDCNSHLLNFLECVRLRKIPNCPVYQGHLSSTLVHLGNSAYRMGNKQLYFNTEKEEFIENNEANQLIHPVFRHDYT